jgi:DNA-binding transcriptional ArsR family regulator
MAISKKAPVPKGKTEQRFKMIQRTVIRLKQVSDPTRLRIILMLSDGEKHVTGICEELGISSQAAVSHHLALLRHGGIINPRRVGQNNFYGLTQSGEELAKIVKHVVA